MPLPVHEDIAEIARRIDSLERGSVSGRINGMIVWECVCGHRMQHKLSYRTLSLKCSSSKCRRVFSRITLDRYPMVNTVNSVVTDTDGGHGDHPGKQCSQSDTATVAAPDAPVAAAPLSPLSRLSKGV